MRIAVVCLGNICRSPMAEVVLRDRLRAAGRDDV
ncbi:MAG: low molecular weight phosphotyrosine protein phosphatase, partial [Nocardioides sp.]|nr:low molecular weight phosphotyrosine protein phosphatase [Nocardioides sp.]